MIIAAIIEPESDEHVPSQWVLDQHRQSHTVVLPTLVPPEVIGAGRVRGDEGGRKARKRRIKDATTWIINRRYIQVNIDQRVSRRATELAPEYNLSGADACVLAAAELARCTILYTWDTGLLKVQDELDGITVQQPQIPAEEGQLMFC